MRYGSNGKPEPNAEPKPKPPKPDGKATIKAGDVVRFRPEWRDAGDDQIVFRAVSDESMGRVDVMAELGWAINPVEVVSVEMIESE